MQHLICHELTHQLYALFELFVLTLDQQKCIEIHTIFSPLLLDVFQYDSPDYCQCVFLELPVVLVAVKFLVQWKFIVSCDAS